MAYDAPYRETYSFTAQAFGGGTITKVIKAPKGRRGKVTHVVAQATVSFVGTTTPAAVQVGDGVTATKFANMPMGAAGAGTAAGSAVTAKDYASGLTGLVPTLPHLWSATDADITVTLAAATGGAPAGTADVEITIDWF